VIPSSPAPGAADAAEQDASHHWRLAWDSALRAVELDLEQAERLIHDMHHGVEAPEEDSEQGDWVAPTLLGQVPAEFADRARALLQRQLDVGERLAEAVVHARSQRRVLGKFDEPEHRPVFVDAAF
jgi:hypothetical protein